MKVYTMKNKSKIVAVFLVCVAFMNFASVIMEAGESVQNVKMQEGKREKIDLAGEWRLALDREDVGEREAWWEHKFTDPIQLPGSLQEQDYGDPVTTETKWISGLHDTLWYLRDEFIAYTKPGTVKVPFWLNPSRTC